MPAAALPRSTGSCNALCMVLPPMLKAATPVGANSRTGELSEGCARLMSSATCSMKKLLPVPAPPVTNKLSGVGGAPPSLVACWVERMWLLTSSNTAR